MAEGTSEDFGPRQRADLRALFADVAGVDEIDVELTIKDAGDDTVLITAVIYQPSEAAAKASQLALSEELSTVDRTTAYLSSRPGLDVVALQPLAAGEVESVAGGGADGALIGGVVGGILGAGIVAIGVFMVLKPRYRTVSTASFKQAVERVNAPMMHPDDLRGAALYTSRI